MTKGTLLILKVDEELGKLEKFAWLRYSYKISNGRNANVVIHSKEKGLSKPRFWRGGSATHFFYFSECVHTQVLLPREKKTKLRIVQASF